MAASCGGGSSSSTTAQSPGTGGSGDPSVDPTLPSWLPPSCLAYHKAVVQAIDCKALDPSKRDAIRNTFGDTSASWKAETHADKPKVDEVGASCTTATASVRADIADKCI